MTRRFFAAFLSSSMFESYKPGQDNLSFHVPDAVYNYKKYVITCKDVGVIRVADAAIFPSKKHDVIIRENAVMDTLLDAKITANVTSEYYKFYDAKIKILI